MAVTKQPELAVDGLIMRKPDQYARQDRFPAFLLPRRVSCLQHRLIRGGERLDQIEHAVPEPRFNVARALIVGGVLRGQLAYDRLASGVDAKQRVHLRGPDPAPPSGERRDQVEHLAL